MLKSNLKYLHCLKHRFLTKPFLSKLQISFPIYSLHIFPFSNSDPPTGFSKNSFKNFLSTFPHCLKKIKIQVFKVLTGKKTKKHQKIARMNQNKKRVIKNLPKLKLKL